MSDWPDDDELTTIAPYRYERVDRGDDDDEGELRWSRISGKEFTPPPGLSRRQRRRWVKNARKDAVDQQKAINLRRVAGARGQIGDGLGLPLLLVALVVAGFVFWPRGHHPAPVAATPAVSAPSASTPTPAPTSATPTPAGPIGNGTDAGPTVGGPTELSSPAGQVAYRFLLALNSYNPANPSPVATWTAQWRGYATSELADQAQQLAPVLFADVTQAGQSLTDGDVTSCTTVGTTATATTWECTVVDNLFPIGGDATSAYTQQPWSYRIEVTGTDTTDPRVDLLALLDRGPIAPAATAAPSPAPSS